MKRKIFLSLLLAVICAFALSSCEKQELQPSFQSSTQISSSDVNQDKSGLQSNARGRRTTLPTDLPPGLEICNSLTTDLVGPSLSNTSSFGNVTIANSRDSVYVRYEADPDNQLTTLDLYIGDCSAMPINGGNNPVLAQFPIRVVINFQQSAVLSFPITDYDSCFCVIAHAVVTNGGSLYGEGTSFNNNNNAQYISYCATPCPPANCNGYTNTQGGWGSRPRGQNPGTFLHNNFSGITVGCSSGYTLSFSSAQAITDFLPQGGTPAPLPQSYLDPTGSISVLAGQVVALALNVEADYIRNGSYLLGAMTVFSPQIELGYDATDQVEILAGVGYNLALKKGTPFLQFSGEDRENERTFETESIFVDNVSLFQEGEQLRSHLVGLNYVFFQFGVAYRFQ